MALDKVLNDKNFEVQVLDTDGKSPKDTFHTSINIEKGRVFDYKLQEPPTVQKKKGGVEKKSQMSKPPLPKTLKRMYVTREDIQAELKVLKKSANFKTMSVSKDDRRISSTKQSFLRRFPEKQQSQSRQSEIISPVRQKVVSQKQAAATSVKKKVSARFV